MMSGLRLTSYRAAQCTHQRYAAMLQNRCLIWVQELEEVAPENIRDVCQS